MSESRSIKICKIKKGKNCRNEKRDVEDLKASIQINGLIQPIVVSPPNKKGNHTIIAGHRRYEACVAIGLEEISCIVKQYENNNLIQLSENIQRKNMTMVDESLAILDLRNSLGVSENKLAKMIGKIPHYITSRCRFAEVYTHIMKNGLIPSSTLTTGLSFEMAYFIYQSERENWVKMVAQLAGKRWTREEIKNYCIGFDPINPKDPKKQQLDTVIMHDRDQPFSVSPDKDTFIMVVSCVDEKQYSGVLNLLKRNGGKIEL